MNEYKMRMKFVWFELRIVNRQRRGCPKMKTWLECSNWCISSIGSVHRFTM